MSITPTIQAGSTYQRGPYLLSPADKKSNMRRITACERAINHQSMYYFVVCFVLFSFVGALVVAND